MAEQFAPPFASLLRQLRVDARLTQEELAEAARLSPRSISDLERGINRSARKDTALLLADALGLSGPKRELFIAVARGKPLPFRPNNLPAQLTTFVGREMELSELRGLVDATRLVTLTGPGGCGKTRLGLQVAGDLLDVWGDGVWLAELAAVTDQDAVPGAIAGALGIPAQPGRPVLGALADALGPQDMLIVLDNCEHLIGGSAKTVEAILHRCPQVHLIATSREPLGIAGERLYRVPSLSLPEPGDDDAAARSCDAVALLADRASAQGSSIDLAADSIELALSVCRQLDGMPLAIELAAARLRSMSLSELSDRLDQRFRLLTGGSRTALPRQQTLRAAIGWSYSLLIPVEQLLLARLSVFAGGFDLAAAEAVCGYGTIDAAEVAALLGSLVDKSLVAAEPAGDGLRYGLLETIRLFAADRLADADGQETAVASAAHSAHYLAVAEAAAPHLKGPTPRTWLALLETERANIMRAAEHAADQSDGTAQVLRFAVATRSYWPFKYGGEEAYRLLLPVLRRPDASADPALFAEALLTAANLAWGADLTASVTLAEKADQVASQLADNRLQARSLAMLTWVYSRGGELERARLVGQEAVRRAREVGDDVLLVNSLANYAVTINGPEAMQIYAEAIACCERAGDALDYYILHNNAGYDAMWCARDIPAARAHLETAIAAAEVAGLPPTFTQVYLGLVLWAEHDFDGARRAFEEGLRLCRRTGFKVAMADAFSGLACLAADMGEWHRAATLHGAAQAVLDQTGNRWKGLEGVVLRPKSLGQIAAAIGDEQLRQAYDAGTALSIGHAIDLALGKSNTP